MSGGHYDYACYDLNRAVEKLTEECGHTDESEKCRKKLIKIIEKISKLVHDLEWCDSGDYGEEDSKKLLKKLEKVKV